MTIQTLPIATTDEMYEMESHAPATISELMEAAGNAVFSKLTEFAKRGSKILVMCGKGHNGGDGLVVARLAHEEGYEVCCGVLASLSELSELTRIKVSLAQESGLLVRFAGDKPLELLQGTYVVSVDAMLGTGLKDDLRGPILEAVQLWPTSSLTLSIDVPTGIDSDTGRVYGCAVVADHVVVLGAAKPYLFLDSGANHVKNWSFADLGIPARETAASYVSGITLPKRPPNAHKGSSRKVLVVAGSAEFRGAAVLACLGALRSGAGYVTLASIPSVIANVANHLPEVTFIELPESDGVVSDQAAKILFERQSGLDSAVFGPGLTAKEAVRDLLTESWRVWTIPSVIDADALNLVAQGVPLPLAPCILTPHPGEAARLLQTTTEEIQSDRFAFAKQLVSRFGKTVLLKGKNTIVCVSGEHCFVNSTGNPGMATAGMGDVLSGVIGTLLAQAAPSDEAAVGGAYLHGLAGDLAAKEIGQIGYSASDLANLLPRARSILTQ